MAIDKRKIGRIGSTQHIVTAIRKCSVTTIARARLNSTTGSKVDGADANANGKLIDVDRAFPWTR